MADLFYILRHGETDWNRDGRLQGQTDVPLNDVGRDQARSVASVVSRLDISACYASDLLRAFETAQIALTQHALNIKQNPHTGLRERNFGSMNGHTHDEIEVHKKENPAFYIDLDGKGRLFPKDGEQDDVFVSRVCSTISELRSKHEDPFLLVTHGGFFRQVIRSFLPYIDIFQPGNCHLYKIETHSNPWNLEQVWPS